MILLEMPTTIFGIPLALRRRDAQQLLQDLNTLWIRQMGTMPGELATDLDSLRKIFDPLARGERLRKLISGMPPPPGLQSRLLKVPIIVTNEQEVLITLEGRAAIFALSNQLQDYADPVVFDPDAICALELQVLKRYREWSMRRIEDVLQLMGGQAEALRISSIAWLLFLLVNGSRSPETALFIQPGASTIDQEKFDGAVRRIVAAFTDELTPGGARSDRHYGVYQGYSLTEARRRLPNSIATGNPYIFAGEENKVIDLIAAELSRPQRAPDVSKVLEAFDELVSAYRKERPRLAILGLAHERRGETRRIRELLEIALDHHRTRPGLPLSYDQKGRESRSK